MSSLVTICKSVTGCKYLPWHTWTYIKAVNHGDYVIYLDYVILWFWWIQLVPILGIASAVKLSLLGFILSKLSYFPTTFTAAVNNINLAHCHVHHWQKSLVAAACCGTKVLKLAILQRSVNSYACERQQTHQLLGWAPAFHGSKLIGLPNTPLLLQMPVAN